MSSSRASVPTALRLWALLASFHRHYWRFLLGVFIRQVLLVGSGFLLVLALRYSLRAVSLPEGIFFALFLGFDAAVSCFDRNLNFRFSERLGYPVFGFLRLRALSKIFEMPMEWHLAHNSGALTGRVNNGVGRVAQTAESLSRELLPALIQTVLSLIPLCYYSPLTAPALFAAVLLFGRLTLTENRRRDTLRSARNENYERDFGMFTECVQSVQPVTGYGQTGRILADYAEVQRSIQQQGIEETRIGHRFLWKRDLALSCARRACQAIWIWQYRAGRLDAPMVMYLNMLVEQLLTSFWNYAALLERIAEGFAPARALVDLLYEEPSIPANRGLLPVPVPEAVGIRMVNVTFQYAKGRDVLRDFTLEIAPGSIVGLVGRSGCGKTTMHQLWSRVFEAGHGSVEVAGEDVRHWPLEQLRGLFSHVSQNGGVFFSEMSIAETIRFSRPEAADAEVEAAARTACIHDDILRMPLAYATRLGQNGTRLSKGQQQRIALAQALIALRHDRKILVLDEFTSALDARTEDQILRNLEPLLEGRTVVIIAHRLATLRKIADRIVVLGETGILEDGTHQELLARDGWYAELSRLQAAA